jgi:hypothetical protein
MSRLAAGIRILVHSKLCGKGKYPKTFLLADQIGMGEKLQTMTSIRLDTDLANEAPNVPGAKSHTEAVPVALREIVALKSFKDLMQKNAGKLKLVGSDE